MSRINKPMLAIITIGLLCLVVLLSLRINLFYKLEFSNKTPPNIIFNSIMKSGSTYIVNTLYSSLRYDIDLIGDKVNRVYWQRYAVTNKVVSKQHAMPSAQYLKYSKVYKNDKVLIHVRDPREVILSLAHHFAARKDTAATVMRRHGLPDNFYELPWSQQVDWCIENKLPKVVNFMNGWLELKAKEDQTKNGIKILITTYDELLQDEMQLFHKILAFYNIPLQRFKHIPIEKNDQVLYRKGQKDEWRTALTVQQKKRVAELVPNDLLRKFNWQP